MNFTMTLRGIAAAALLAVASAPALAQDDNAALTTTDDVRAEVSEAMDAIADYSEQERDEALSKAREALARLDAEIERREQALRENWSDMSDSAQDTARARLKDLREARNTLSERYGALQSGASSAWDELKSGFSDAWTAFSDAWSDADDDTKAE